MNGANDVTWDRLLEHGQFLRALARALVSDEARAADVEQSTWLAAAEHPPKDQARVRGWLRRVATNVARQFERSERRRVRRDATSATGAALPSADAAAQEVEAQRLVLEAVRDLDAKYRTVVVLRFYEDLGTGAIAERLGLPLATVRTQLQRALAILREQLDAKFEGRREQWQQALAPLAGEVAKHAVAPVVVAIAVVTLGLVAGGWWSVNRRSPRPAPTPQTASAPAAGAKGAASTPASPPAQATVQREPVAARDLFEGHVIDSMGRPIEGAQIEMFDDFRRRAPGSPPRQAVRSDARGRFRLVGVGFGEMDVVTSRDGFVRSRAMLQRARGGMGLVARTHYEPGATIVLEDARAVRGVVVDSDGRPVTTASVIEFDGTRSLEGIPSEASVDGQGRFELSGLPLETVDLIAVAPGFGPAQVVLRNGQSEATVRMTQAPRCTLDVSVVDSQGKLLPDAEVELKFNSPSSTFLFSPSMLQLPSSFSVRTLSADGHLVRSDLPPGPFEVRASSRVPVDPIQAATVVLDPAESKSLELRSPGQSMAVTVRGVVKGGDGAPIANVAVVARWLANPAPVARTDAQGRFEITGAMSARGQTSLFLDDPDWVLLDPSGRRGEVTVRAGATNALELTAERAASIRGRAAAPDGSPAADVLLELRVVEADAKEVLATAITDPGGHFAFDSLPPGTTPVEIVVVRGSTNVSMPERFDLRAAAPRDDVRLTIPELGSIRGRVVDSKGSPRQGIPLLLHPGDLRAHPLTNHAGEFLLPDLLDGEATLQVAAPDGASPGEDTKRNVTIAGGRPVDGVEFTLDERAPENGSISGRIVLRDGGPRRGAHFFVNAMNDTGEVSGQDSAQNFRLDGLAPGHYRLLARTADDEPIAADGPVVAFVSKVAEAQAGDADAILEFPPSNESARVVARFTSSEGDLAGTLIDWNLSTNLSEEEDGGFTMVQGMRLGNGEFRLRVATPGTYRISFGIDFERFFSRVIKIPPKGDVDLGEIPIHQKQLHGVVTDRLATPIANALVVAESDLEWRMMIDRGATPDLGVTRVRTDAKGAFTIPLGTSGLCFWKKGFAPRRFAFDEDPRPADDVFVLLPAGDLRLTNFPAEMVRSEAETWVVTLVWNDAESELHGYPATRSAEFSTRDGSQELFRLPAGRHLLHLWKKTAEPSSDDSPPPPAPHSSYAWPIELRAGEVTTIDVGARW